MTAKKKSSTARKAPAKSRAASARKSTKQQPQRNSSIFGFLFSLLALLNIRV